MATKKAQNKGLNMLPAHTESGLATYSLRNNPLPFPIYGADQIGQEAIQQMRIAMSLPVSVAGALMPDAHTGYGLPIGGVLATLENIVIPYAVGVDIACRMCMSVFNVEIDKLEKKKDYLIQAIIDNTIFGVGGNNSRHIDTGLFDQKGWQETSVLRELKDLAYSQFGTSGAGNHFVEWGILEVLPKSGLTGLKPGTYLALLTHSGSRGFGAAIADYYSRLAKQLCNLPDNAKHLSWLHLDRQEGAEYWTAMNLAGDYASHNHREIHQKIIRQLGWEPVFCFENHHNFAWKEKLPDGKRVVVHRKGATPAAETSTGIIPGSMATNGYVVRGRGNSESLRSASHGAGRVMSRTKAIGAITWNDLEKTVQKAGVTLIGGDVDESPEAYKDIEQVMALQKDLVQILARFTPKIVRMANPARRKKKKGQGMKLI